MGFNNGYESGYEDAKAELMPRIRALERRIAELEAQLAPEPEPSPGPAPSGDRPTVTDYEADSMPSEPIYLNGGTLHVNGTNLAGATKILFRFAEDGEPFYEADPTEVTDTVVDCGSLGYSGEVESTNGYLSVVTPKGESNKIPCTFAV